jgi:hypothetical protein
MLLKKRESSMSALNTDLLKRAEAILRQDPIVAENVRWHDASITLVCDAKRWTFEVREGCITLEPDEHPREQPEILIRGQSEDWRPLLKGMQGGLHRAFRHKLLAFEGDAVAMLTLWKTVWRVGESISLASKEE